MDGNYEIEIFKNKMQKGIAKHLTKWTKEKREVNHAPAEYDVIKSRWTMNLLSWWLLYNGDYMLKAR